MLPITQLHPAIVHFPIVLALTVLAIDLWSLRRNQPLGAVADSLAVGAGLFAGLAAILGDAAAEAAVSGGVADTVIETHESLGMLTAAGLILFGLIRGWSLWRGRGYDGGIRTGVIAGQALLVILVLATAYYGGQLVYDHGVNVTLQAG